MGGADRAVGGGADRVVEREGLIEQWGEGLIEQ